MRKHGGTPSRRDKYVPLAAISPPVVVWGRFVGGQQSGLAECKPPPLFKRRASSRSSQRQHQREPRGASPRPSARTYLPYLPTCLQDARNKKAHAKADAKDNSDAADPKQDADNDSTAVDEKQDEDDNSDAADEKQDAEDDSDSDINAEDEEEADEDNKGSYDEGGGLILKLDSDYLFKVCARESLLLDSLRRTKIDRWSEVTDGMLLSDSLTDHVRDYAGLVMGKGNVRSCVASRYAYRLKRRFQTRIEGTIEQAIVFCFAIGLGRRLGVQKKGHSCNPSSALQMVIICM